MTSARSAPTLSVITVCHNSMNVLPGWLESMEASGARDQMEICVVDSGSAAAQVEHIESELADRIDVFAKRPNIGFGGASNVGAELTSAPVLFFTNPDLELLSLPVDALRGNVGERLIGAFRKDPDRSGGYADFPSLRDEVQKLAVGAWSRRYVREPQDPAWVTGAAMLINREAFDRIGGFSSRFFMYFEDADICARHREAGGTVEVAPDFVIRHGKGESTDEDGRHALVAPLDSLNRLSARRFASVHGARWQGPFLYLVLAIAYVPRRALLELIRERHSPAQVADYTACLLNPRRALRRLNAAIPGRP